MEAEPKVETNDKDMEAPEHEAHVTLQSMTVVRFPRLQRFFQQ